MGDRLINFLLTWFDTVEIHRALKKELVQKLSSNRTWQNETGNDNETIMQQLSQQ